MVLHADVQPSIPVEPGKPERVDYEYERRGTRNLFVMVEPTLGLATRGSDRTTHHAGLRPSGALARRFCLSAGRVYPARAGQASTRMPLLPSTKPFPLPKHGVFSSASSSTTRGIHGSWLNMAEIEIAIL